MIKEENGAAEHGDEAEQAAAEQDAAEEAADVEAAAEQDAAVDAAEVQAAAEQAAAEQAAALEAAEVQAAALQDPPAPVPPAPSWVQALPTLAATFLWTVAIGFGIGLFQGLLTFPHRRDFSLTNALPAAYRHVALLNMGSWILGCLLAVAIFLLYKGRSWKRVDTAHNIVRAFSPLAWLWPLPLYFDWEIFQASGLERVVIAVVWGLGLERCFRHTFRVAVPFVKSLALAQRLAAALGRLPRLTLASFWLALLCGMIIWFASFCAHYTVMQHQRLATTAFDLGIFDNLFYNLLQGEFFKGGVDIDNRGGNHLQFHANFLAYLFVPLYALSPRAETLLQIQAWVVGLSAIPLFLLVQNRLKSFVAAFAISFVYLAHEAVQGPIFYDFHDLTLAPFFIGWTLYFFERGFKWSLLIMWVFAMLLREEQGAVLSAAALVYLLAGERPRVAIFGGIVGVLWLIGMRFYLMPMFTADGEFQQHIGYYKGMLPEGDAGFVGVLKTMITNPVFMMNSLLNLGKIEYTLLLAAPFVLLPFRSPRLLLLFIPAALFTLGTRNYPPPVSKGFQYTMYWMPLLVLGAALKLDEWRRTPGMQHHVPAAVAALFVVGGAMGVNGGALFQQNSFTGGFRRIVFEISEEERERYQELRTLIEKVPKNATMLGTESVVPHFSNRAIAYTVRQGVPDVEYFLFWKAELRGGEQGQRLVDYLSRPGEARHGVIEQTKNFQLWKRGASTKNNIAAMHALGHFRHLRPDGTPRVRGKSRPASIQTPPAQPPNPPQTKPTEAGSRPRAKHD